MENTVYLAQSSINHILHIFTWYMYSIFVTVKICYHVFSYLADLHICSDLRNFKKLNWHVLGNCCWKGENIGKSRSGTLSYNSLYCKVTLPVNTRDRNHSWLYQGGECLHGRIVGLKIWKGYWVPFQWGFAKFVVLIFTKTKITLSLVSKSSDQDQGHFGKWAFWTIGDQILMLWPIPCIIIIIKFKVDWGQGHSRNTL